MNPLFAIGARIAPYIARALSASAWASLGWTASEAVGVASGSSDADESTSKSWAAMAGGGFVFGLLVLFIALKAIPALKRK